jgi:sugar fermentation stimulation protein A
MARQPDSGLYVAVFQLDRAEFLQIGRLGRFAFAPGFYFYVGSARRNRTARLTRHARRDKPQRWHIDYLSCRAEMLGAILADPGRWSECALAEALADRMQRSPPRFGAGDCRCPGHLLYCPDWPGTGQVISIASP